jgi:antitoxin (DNA-binding transcriptional repressor) of toxin-antitoxin stability system
MHTTQEITTKNLHDATGKIVRAAKRGQAFSVSLDGEKSALIVPPGESPDPSWDEIMREVRAARAKGEPLRPNPILAERKKRNYAARLR